MALDWSSSISDSNPAPLDSEDYIVSFELSQEQELKTFFAKYGFVVVRNVISENQVDQTVDEIWSCKEGKH